MLHKMHVHVHVCLYVNFFIHNNIVILVIRKLYVHACTCTCTCTISLSCILSTGDNGANYQSLTAYPEYRETSFEELRTNYYNKGGGYEISPDMKRDFQDLAYAQVMMLDTFLSSQTIRSDVIRLVSHMTSLFLVKLILAYCVFLLKLISYPMLNITCKGFYIINYYIYFASSPVMSEECFW